MKIFKQFFSLFILCFTIICFFSCKTDAIPESEKAEIITELNAIKTLDQKYAGLPPVTLTDKYGYEKGWEIFEIQRDSIGLLNQNKIKELYKKYGYLGYKEIGKQASHDFWISIQHADNDIEFQQAMLEELKKEIAINNGSKSEYAMLEDRVHINTGKKQRFGTQVTYNSFGQSIPKNGLIDSVNIDKLRKEFDLPTFREYYNEMTIDHFEMNKSNMLKRGIAEPKLYK
ncbi:hypothetical protein CLV90_0201 [Maribacter spongiicola]|uniref:Lipoprotein n=1 Tax=Maribacter spongiicola TaxID=1206753 RepID=A0A4R7K6X5_9FLAO|nr:DUF6624 domain-containing protein [Maribacter spongiicola]TDT46158.1 hypothetical protein CLV90_0201 [Maribacter spongiicola]